MQTSTVVILGSTGSIGTQGLDVISRHLDRFNVVGLAAGGSHVELLAQQAVQFHVSKVAIFNTNAVHALQDALNQAGASMWKSCRAGSGNRHGRIRCRRGVERHYRIHWP